MKILVIGHSTRYIVQSGAKAGYQMYAIDGYWRDLDLCRYAKTFPLARWKERVKDINPDAVIFGSGFERVRLSGYRVFNNPWRIMKNVTNKLWLSKKLLELGFPVPEIYEGRAKFPAIAKPLYGAGGYKNFLVKKQRKIPYGFFLQKFIHGKPVSVSLISTGSSAIALSINEILVGRYGAPRFGYCGSITPLSGLKEHKAITRMAEEIACELSLIGSNGVDFILTKNGFFVIDVNPRFQASMDTIELARGMNIFELHLRSFMGELPKVKKAERFASKLIIFAQEDCRTGNLDRKWIADIPPENSLIRKKQPVATAIGIGRTRELSLAQARKRSSFIKSSLFFVKKN